MSRAADDFDAAARWAVPPTVPRGDAAGGSWPETVRCQTRGCPFRCPAVLVPAGRTWLCRSCRGERDAEVTFHEIDDKVAWAQVGQPSTHWPPRGEMN